MLLAHQEKVFGSLLETAEVFLREDWRRLPVHPRFSRFVVGPSGVGKSHVVRHLAQHLQLPLLAQDGTNWIPLGASERGAKQTWSDVLGFIRRHERGIIFLDEIDKLGRHDSLGSNAWLHFVRVEIFSLLDRRIPEGLLLAAAEEDGDDGQLLRDRLKGSFMIVGAGAFQEFWDIRAKPVAGFKADVHACAGGSMDHAEAARFVATEIINRFEGPVLALRPLDADDYRSMLTQLVAKLPAALARDAHEIGSADLGAAVQSQLGVRWLEQVVYRVLARRRRRRPVRSPRARVPKTVETLDPIITAALRPAR